MAEGEPQGVLEVRRLRGSSGIAIALDVLIDGRPVGSVRVGKQVDVVVQAGPHTVAVRMRSRGRTYISEAFDVVVGDDEHVVINFKCVFPMGMTARQAAEARLLPVQIWNAKEAVPALPPRRSWWVRINSGPDGRPSLWRLSLRLLGLVVFGPSFVLALVHGSTGGAIVSGMLAAVALFNVVATPGQ